MLQCARCRAAWFCCVDCQRAAWPVRAAVHGLARLHVQGSARGPWTLAAAHSRAKRAYTLLLVPAAGAQAGVCATCKQAAGVKCV